MCKTSKNDLPSSYTYQLSLVNLLKYVTLCS